MNIRSVAEKVIQADRVIVRRRQVDADTVVRVLFSSVVGAPMQSGHDKLFRI